MFILLTIFVSLFSFSKMQDPHCEVRGYSPAYLSQAYGQLSSLKKNDLAPWPVSLISIGHNMASYQYYGGGLDQAYFHHGLDIRAESGSPVHASKPGKVVNAANYNGGSPLYWEVAVLDDDGFIWQYHHIESTSIPSSIKKASQTGGRVQKGDFIGNVVNWPVTTYGERYHHIHLNILDKDKNFVNPFYFLDELTDTQAPQILEIGFVRKDKIVPGNHISGDYNLYLKVQDLILHDKFIVPPYEITYRINQEEPQTVWRFDHLPGGSVEERFSNEFFIPNLTCGDYSCRKMFINLGFTPSGNRKFPTTKGNHELEVSVRDFVGNKDSKIFRYTID